MRCFLILSAVLGGAFATFAATGGPDPDLYTWADSDEPEIDVTFPVFIQNDLRALGLNGDESVTRIDLPISAFPDGFPFYGQNYSELWISSNGWISFQDPQNNTARNPVDISDPAEPNALLAFFWDDLTFDCAAPLATGGEHTDLGGYSFQLRLCRASQPADIMQLFVSLYRSGIIRIFHVGGGNPSAQTVLGLENTDGSSGLPYMASGQPLNNANFRDNYTIQFNPPPLLDCQNNVTALTCPSPVTAYSNLGGSNRVTNYNCSNDSFDGNEKVFSVDVPEVSRFSATLDNTDGRDRRLFLVEETCNEMDGCRTGGTTQVDVAALPPGRYYLVVDGVTTADNGDFTLTTDCAPFATPVPCGSTLLSEFTATPSELDSWDCLFGLDGPEKSYSIDVVNPGTLRATLLQKSNPDLHVLLTESKLDVDRLTCSAIDPVEAKLWNVLPGRYYATVDGLFGASGTYDLNIGCESLLDCTNAMPLDPTSPQTVIGDTTGKPNNVDEYLCASSQYGTPGEKGDYTGSEDVYEFTVTSPTLVAFDFRPSNPDMRLLLLKDCYEGSCLSEGGCGESLSPGTYRLVVDGLSGAEGAYSLTPYVLPPQPPRNRWWDCPECTGGCGQAPEDTVLKKWQFNSGNFCGTGCDFAMYVVVGCGTEMHLPFWDGETGHLEIYDVLNGQAIELVATNELPANAPLDPTCAYTDTGTHVQWEDSGCSAIPCPAGGCGGGADCRTNVQVMDVQMLGTPNLCGVFRIDMLNWGGWFWELYANCTADLTEQFNIYGNLCSALTAFSAKPEVGITNLWFDNDSCIDDLAHGTITLENVGCVDANQIEIVIEQAPPAPSNPKVLTFDVLPGLPLTAKWTYQLTTRPVDLLFRVDPFNKTAECSEDLNGAVACGQAAQLKRDWTIEVCGTSCLVIPDAGPLKNICAGSPCVLDGAGSDFRCGGAGVPEYRWEDSAGNPLSGCDWSPSPVCEIPPNTLPPIKNRFTLHTRCSGDPAKCSKSIETAVIVGNNVAPDGLGNILRAYRSGADVNFVWSSDICVGTSAFRVYEDGAPGLPTVSRSLLPDGNPSDHVAIDQNGTTDPPSPVGYYQLVGVSCDGDLEGAY